MKPIHGLRSTAIAVLLAMCQTAFAHAPVLDCFFEQETVKCEAGFSDGSAAAGRKIQVRDPSGRVLFEGVLDKTHTYAFAPPAGTYSVVFLGGDGHDVTFHSSDITK